MGRKFTSVVLKSVVLLSGIALMAGSATAQQSRVGSAARAQIETLMQEKAARSPAQRKISSHLLYEMKRRRGDPLFQAVPSLRSSAEVDRTDQVEVDIKAEVTDGLLQQIEALGGSVIGSVPRYRSIRARLPLNQLEALAASPQVTAVRPAARGIINKVNSSQGDVAHRANLTRIDLGSDGTGTKICALSDSIDHLEGVQASGDLPADIDILPGQDGLGLGSTGEGTAMLEIVHDLAPGAELGFATAWLGPESFAQNILDLRAAGCDIIVDDVVYLEEPVLQDGVVAAAVDTVVADGAMYFSSAGNFGNMNDGTSAVWEGDFVDSGSFGNLGLTAGNAHDFGGGNIGNQVQQFTPLVMLQWADPSDASANDYDLCVLSGDFSIVFECSTDVQDGTGFPLEVLMDGAYPGEQIVVINSGNSAEPRYLHLNALWGPLVFATPGQTWGHSAAQGAFSVAAVNWYQGSGVAPFKGDEPVERFSSDGPRRIFYNADGAAVTPGNFSATGGELRPKPDIAAADGVSTATPGFDPFFGTSAAAPHAAAVAGLFLALDPTLNSAAMRSIFASTALDIEAPGTDRDSGLGIVVAPTDMEQLEVERRVVTDFNADLLSDILWHRVSDGSAAIWQMNGFIKQDAATIGAPSTDWKVAGIGDFDGDLSADILWRNSSTGSAVIWRMSGFTRLNAAAIGAPATIWKVVGIDDFDGDGKADILWRHGATGSAVIWLMDGFTQVSAGSIGAPLLVWEVVGTGYFNDDLFADVLWRNGKNGAVAVWRMDGLAPLAKAVVGGPGKAWNVVGVGDFNDGGISDILWHRSSDGATVIWQMNGWLQEDAAVIGTIGGPWRVVRVGDFGGDGKADILWRNQSDGNTVIWQMDGLTKNASGVIGTVDLAWQVR
jgi:hypothetical protein